jgi:1-acyl-sn-glycerol-3-phosphate acyltransferase
VVRLGLILAIAAIGCIQYWLFIYRIGRDLPGARAQWLHGLIRRAQRVLAMRIDIAGSFPASGLIVANHLSYVDVLVLSAIRPVAFVAKAEVENWPVFGFCAKCAGTVFIERERRSAVAPVLERMQSVLTAGVPLVLFPEGTSSNGDTVLPFKPALFAVVERLSVPVTTCAIGYSLRDGSVRDEICYWGTHDFLSHLVNLLTKTGISARVAFGPERILTGDRKTLARQLRDEVVELRSKAT